MLILNNLAPRGNCPPYTPLNKALLLFHNLSSTSKTKMKCWPNQFFCEHYECSRKISYNWPPNFCCLHANLISYTLRSEIANVLSLCTLTVPEFLTERRALFFHPFRSQSHHELVYAEIIIAHGLSVAIDTG
jgi:hypothetical protein